MTEMIKILELSQRIAQEFQPEQIILFGSHAYGEPDADSDVDMLVILSFEGQPFQKSFEILSRTNPHFPVDLLVRTPEQIKQRLAWNDFFIREILEKGKILHAVAHSGVG